MVTYAKFTKSYWHEHKEKLRGMTFGDASRKIAAAWRARGDFKSPKQTINRKRTGGLAASMAHFPPASQVFARLNAKPLKPGTFVGRGSWADVLEASGLTSSISSGGGQATDQLNIYDTIKKKSLGFVPINGNLVIQPDTKKYKLTWICPQDENGYIDFEKDAIKKQKLVIQEL